MELIRRPLADYVRDRFGPDAVVEKAVRFPRGASRLTWFVEYRPRPGAAVVPLVFRGDFPGGSTILTTLDQEYFMYERLAQTAVPVARPLFWEGRPDWVDRPFYVREQVEGSWNVPDFADPDPRFDALRIAISKEHLRKLALVHTVDWRAHGFDTRLPTATDPARTAADFIDNLMAPFAGFAMESFPILVESIAWLKERAPVAPRISLCKGTNGLGEEVFKDGTIVAMSDWEEATIGDPSSDFASLQAFIPEIERDGRKLWGLEAALDYYREVSGIAVTVEAVRFYQHVRALGTLVFSHNAAVIAHKGRADIRQTWTGTETTHLGKRLLGAAIGLSPPVDPTWFTELNESIV